MFSFFDSRIGGSGRERQSGDIRGLRMLCTSIRGDQRSIRGGQSNRELAGVKVVCAVFLFFYFIFNHIFNVVAIKPLMAYYIRMYYRCSKPEAYGNM